MDSSLPNGTPATTINEASGSGLRAITLAADRIRSGEADVAIAGGFESLAELVDYDLVYRRPDEFNEALADVVELLLATNDLEPSDVGTLWINEAFAAQSVYVIERVGIPRAKMNPCGGAIAFGHPIGASSGMVTTSLAYELHEHDLTFGVTGMSVGGGGAILSLWRRC